LRLIRPICALPFDGISAASPLKRHDAYEANQLTIWRNSTNQRFPRMAQGSLSCKNRPEGPKSPSCQVIKALPGWYNKPQWTCDLKREEISACQLSMN
jgi:hypothetical protein